MIDEKESANKYNQAQGQNAKASPSNSQVELAHKSQRIAFGEVTALGLLIWACAGQGVPPH